MQAQTNASFIFILVLTPASITFLLRWNFFSESWHIVCLVLVSCFLVWAEKWLFLEGPFSGHRFWQEGVRPNCLASPLLAKICGQKMATVLGTAFGRPCSGPRLRGRELVSDCGSFLDSLWVLFSAPSFVSDLWSAIGFETLLRKCVRAVLQWFLPYVCDR